VSEKPLIERLREEGNRIVNYNFGRAVAALLFEAADALQALLPAASKARTLDEGSLVSEVENRESDPTHAAQGKDTER
jgi:hypothetical protein